MDKVIPFPTETPDVRTMILDGKPEVMLSARGVVLMCLSSWRLDKNENARGCLQRYCEYLAMHGYRGGAQKVLSELDRLGKNDAIAWIKRTFARYVQDHNALVRYVMGPISGGGQ